MRAKAGSFRHTHLVHQPAPQRAAGILLRLKTTGAHEAIAIACLTTRKINLVDHAVAIKGMITPKRLVKLVFRVAQIDAVNVVRNAAFDHRKVRRGDLFMLRRPRTVEIGVVARLQRCFHRWQFVD